jgi:hypothetical protein
VLIPKIIGLKNKRKKTSADVKEIRDLQFLSSLYWSEDLQGLYMPSDNVRKMLLESARALDQRGAKKQIVGVSFDHYLGWPLQVENRDSLEKLRENERLKYTRIVTIQKSKVVGVRAIFYTWSFELNIDIDDEIVDPSTVENWFIYAGKRVGLCGRRPYGPTPGEYGKFLVESFKEIK